MKELFLKDFAIVRHVQLLGVLLIGLPFAMQGLMIGQSWFLGDGVSSEHVFNALISAAYSGLLISFLPIMLVVAYSIAGERQDRTAEFMFYLPPSRAKILLSKSLVCGTWCAGSVLM